MTPASPVLPAIPDLPSIVIAKAQKAYQPLPALVTVDGQVVTRWRLTWRERLMVLLTGNVFAQVWTFKSKLQPMKLSADYPGVLISNAKTLESGEVLPRVVGLPTCLDLRDMHNVEDYMRRLGLIELRDHVLAPFVGE